jgi:hypothetical protein
MEKNRLLIIPFFVGLMLLIYSWFLSFPLSVTSISDSIFNHISIFYWLSVPLLLISIFLMALSFKNKYYKMATAVGFVLVLYSLSYFYFTMSTSDAVFFRGLIENFIRTNNLDISKPIHDYYQWPSFFLLASITTLVTGLKVTAYEFLLFTIIGFLMATALYVYVSKAYSKSGSLAVAAFFIVMFLFLNYQAVPFSVAFGLLFVLFMLETNEKSFGTTLTTLILFTSTVLTHAFVPLFFVIYLLIRSIIKRSMHYFELFVLTLAIYLIAQITLVVFSFKSSLISIFVVSSEYSRMAGATLAPTSFPIDTFPRLFSRTVTVAFGILCLAGFIFVLIRRKLRKIDIAIFLTGAVYSGLGLVLYTLGGRAIAIVFVPISLGFAYLFETKFRKYLKYLVLVLLIFVPFVSMHSSINSFPISFQTKDDTAIANFMIDKYDWNSKNVVIGDDQMTWYISPQIPGNTQIDTDLAPTIGLSHITQYDSIIYSVGLAQTLNMSNLSLEATSQKIMNSFDIVYDSGSSYIAIKASNPVP